MCPPDLFDGEIGERGEAAKGVLRGADRLRPGPPVAGGADHESLEPRLCDLAEPLGRRLVEGARLAPALDVELERLRVLVYGERARALAAVGVSVADLVAALPLRCSV